MAVALDVAGTVITGTVSPVNSSTSITVGASASCLLVTLQTDDNNATLSAPTWNGVALTQIGKVNTTDSGCVSSLYGMLNPASGAKALSVSWTGGAPSIHMCAVSFTGSSTVSIAACFPGFTSQVNNTAGTSNTVTVTSAVGNIAVAAGNGNNGSYTLNQTSIYNATTSFISAASRAAGAATVTFTGTVGTTTNCIVGCDVAAAASGFTDLRNFFVAPWREPVRIKPSVVWQQFRAEPPGGVSKEDIARFEWTTLWQDPVRIKPAVAYQQFLAFDPIVIAAQSGTGDMWYASWSSTGRRVILIGTG